MAGPVHTAIPTGLVHVPRSENKECSATALAQAERDLHAYANRVAHAEGVSINARTLARFDPVAFDPAGVDLVEQQAQALGCNYQWSRARRSEPQRARAHRTRRFARRRAVAGGGGVGQLGPIQRSDSRTQVVHLCALMRQVYAVGAQLIVFPELALTTFFPRWYIEDEAEINSFLSAACPMWSNSLCLTYHAS